MLISKFANKFNVRTDTIRYYMELGLLLPEKRNHYYEFDETCVEEMKWIQELKSFKFSLQEINKILALKRVTSLSNEADISFLIQMLEEKKQFLQGEVDSIHEACEAIDKKITSIRTSRQTEAKNNGLEFTVLSILYCPYCQSSLELEEAKTKEQQIFHGKLYCPNCAYTAMINEGIIITKHLNQHSFNSFYIYDIEMLKTIQSSFISLSEKASIFVKQMLMQLSLKDKTILETNIDTYVFLDKYIAELDLDATYIFTGSTLPMLKMLKEKIEKQNPRPPILYVLNSGLDLPFKHGSIDYFIDSYSFNEYSLFHQMLPMKKLKPYLQDDSFLIGCYFQYEENANTLSEMKKLHPYAHPNNLKARYIKENMQDGHFEFVEQMDIGNTTDPGQYIKYHIPGEKAKFFAYKAERRLS